MPQTTSAELALDAYLETMLWASTDDHGEPLDEHYGPEDLAPVARQATLTELQDFWDLLLRELPQVADQYTLRDLAHDFWLTRNGHGAGFWDGAYPADLGRELTKWAKSFGSQDVYVGEDGLLYLS